MSENEWWIFKVVLLLGNDILYISEILFPNLLTDRCWANVLPLLATSY